jgi:hypothetical protein
MGILIAIIIVLAILCILLAQKMQILKDQSQELNDKLNMSDAEYISLFNTYIELSYAKKTSKLNK